MQLIVLRSGSVNLGLANVVFDALLSAFIVIVLVVAVNRGLHYGKDKQPLRSILKDAEGYYSLTNFQFLSWTIVFLFSVIWVYFVRMQGDVLTPIQQLPSNTLVLMGINAVSALGGTAVTIKPKKRKNWDKGFWEILYSEPNKPDLTRVQFFVWTVASIIIYLAILMGQMFGPYLFGFSLLPLNKLSIPDIDPSLVTLMGLSHVGYVGGKYVQHRQQVKPRIRA